MEMRKSLTFSPRLVLQQNMHTKFWLGNLMGGDHLPNAAAEWLVLLVRIWDVLKSGYPNQGF